MSRFLSLFFLSIFLTISSNGQSVEGILQDATDKTPVPGATIKLIGSGASSKSYSTVSNNKGTFLFSDIPAGTYTLIATSIGYQDKSTVVNIGSNTNDLGIIKVAKGAKTLQTVVVKDEAPTIKQKNDTMEFGASQYKVNPDATSEDLIKKMPGITVDKNPGDATATLRNLPADIIDKIQVFDKLSDQAQLTGFDDGNTTKAINIVTKVDMRNGNFGRIYAGYGTDDRYRSEERRIGK